MNNNPIPGLVAAGVLGGLISAMAFYPKKSLEDKNISKCLHFTSVIIDGLPKHDVQPIFIFEKCMERMK